MREIFKNKRLEGFYPKIDKSILLDKQNLQKKTLAILAMINTNYWCESEEEKEELYYIYNENERIQKEELREKYK